MIEDFQLQSYLINLRNGNVIVEECGGAWLIYDDKLNGIELAIDKNKYKTKIQAIADAERMAMKMIEHHKVKDQLNEKIRCPDCSREHKESRIVHLWEDDFECSNGHFFKVIGGNVFDRFFRHIASIF